MQKRKRKAFTLIEMMMVLVMLGIVMGAVAYKLKSVSGKARDVARIRDITTLAQALNLYYMDMNTYPAHTPNPAAGLSGAALTGVNCGGSGCGWETSLDPAWMTGLVGKYITTAPKDPFNVYNNMFPWNALASSGSSSTASIYVYANYASGYIWGDLTSCTVPNYALIGVSNLEQTTPGMWPACPGYDWSTLVDYGFVLFKGTAYAEYTRYPLAGGSGSSNSGAINTGGVGGLHGTWIPGGCGGSNAASYSLGQAISCNCDNDDVEPNDDNVWGTNEYTHNSKMCNAAAHAGVIPFGGGNISILITPGRSNYIGSKQNGITSKSRQNGPRSFRVYYYVP